MTVKPLPLTVAYQQGETPTSFASRLGRRNGVENLWHFCQDVQLPARELINGETAALQRLGSLGGVDWRLFVPNTLIHDGFSSYSLNGQEIGKKYLRRDKLFACPYCFEDDVRSASLPFPEVAFYRASWQIVWLRTCITHSQTLVELPPPKKGLRADTAELIATCADEFAAWKSGSRSATPGDHEVYLARRMAGTAGYIPILDDLRLDVAARACEMIGAMSFGEPRLKELPADQIAQCREVGFKIVAGGEHSLRSIFREILDRALDKGPNRACLLNIYRPFYPWLVRHAKNSNLDTLRDIVRDQIINTFPIGRGEKLLGKVVEKRVVHSICSASAEISSHPARLRKLLRAHGFTTSSQDRLSDDSVLFEAEAAGDLLNAIKTSVPACRAGSYLGTTEVQTNLLIRAGLLKPFARKGPGLNGNSLSTAEMERFLAELLKEAVPAEATETALVDIAAASHRSTRSLATIVSLILEGRLTNVRRDMTKHGFASVLIDPLEVRQELCKSGFDGLAAYKVASELHINVGTIDALIAIGALSTVAQMNPITRQLVNLVPREQVNHFEAVYVTVTALARQHRTSASIIKRVCSEDGVLPAFDEGRIGATIYEKKILPEIRIRG